MSTLSKALKHLGFEDFVLQNNDGVDEIIEWHSELPQPTQEAIDQAKIDWQAEQNANQYKRDRAAEYPSIEALVVALWEGVVEERMSAVTALEAIRQEIKSRYPKP